MIRHGAILHGLLLFLFEAIPFNHRSPMVTLLFKASTPHSVHIQSCSYMEAPSFLLLEEPPKKATGSFGTAYGLVPFEIKILDVIALVTPLSVVHDCWFSDQI